MNIIIVDDNRTNQLVIERMLNKAGYGNVTAVSSARELFSLLGMDSTSTSTSTFTDELHVNLILMDMMMPEIDGVEATKRLQSNEQLREIPIIFVTALGDSNKLAEAFDAGATDYVMKPINKVELLARIRSALRLKFEKDWHRERDKRIQFELELAKRVQRSVLSLPIDDEKVAISAFYKPSFELAGDSYAWYPIDKNRYGIILLDMMGHGISSSLVCMFISSVLQDNITRISDPEQVIHELNRYMNQLEMIDGMTQYYFTAIYMVLDTEQKTIEYVNAGHPPGMAFKDDSIVLLTEGCCGVGLFDNIHITKGTIHYEDSIRIVLFTDGMMETKVDEAEDSIDKLLDELKACKEMDLHTLVNTCIPQAINGSQKDDICVVMITTK